MNWKYTKLICQQTKGHGRPRPAMKTFCRGASMYLCRGYFDIMLSSVLTGLVLLGPAVFANFVSVGLKNSQNWQTRKHIDTVVDLLVSPILGLFSKPRHQTKGYHVPLRLCGSWGPSPALGTAKRGCRTLLFGDAGS